MNTVPCGHLRKVNSYTDMEKKKNKIRRSIDAFCDENGFEDTLILDGESYDEAIIGVSHDGRLIYDYNKMVACLAKRYAKQYAKDGDDHSDDDPETDAVEWIDYNTKRALLYMESQGKAPIILEVSRKELLEIYGDR